MMISAVMMMIKRRRFGWEFQTFDIVFFFWGGGGGGQYFHAMLSSCEEFKKKDNDSDIKNKDNYDKNKKNKYLGESHFNFDYLH